MLDALALWLASHTPAVLTGIGTRFAPAAVDRFNVDGWACPIRNPTPLQRWLVNQGAIVAHRTLPCGSIVLVCVKRTARCALSLVRDRGPKRALVDLWHDLSAMLRHNGREAVVAITWSRP